MALIAARQKHLPLAGRLATVPAAISHTALEDLIRSREELNTQRTTLENRIAELSCEIAERTRPSWETGVHLSPREREILALVQKPLSNREISDSLGLKLRTVKMYVSNLLRKYDRNNRGELIAMRNVTTIILLLMAVCVLGVPVHAQQGPQATLNWTAPTVAMPGALSYILERATAATGPWTTVATITVIAPATAPATSSVDTGIQPGHTYWWRVTSSCPATGNGCGTTLNPSNGNSVPSASATGTVPNATTAPPAPGALTLTIP